MNDAVVIPKQLPVRIAQPDPDPQIASHPAGRNQYDVACSCLEAIGIGLPWRANFSRRDLAVGKLGRGSTSACPNRISCSYR